MQIHCNNRPSEQDCKSIYKKKIFTKNLQGSTLHFRRFFANKGNNRSFKVKHKSNMDKKVQKVLIEKILPLFQPCEIVFQIYHRTMIYVFVKKSLENCQ